MILVDVIFPLFLGGGGGLVFSFLEGLYSSPFWRIVILLLFGGIFLLLFGGIFFLSFLEGFSSSPFWRGFLPLLFGGIFFFPFQRSFIPPFLGEYPYGYMVTHICTLWMLHNGIKDIMVQWSIIPFMIYMTNMTYALLTYLLCASCCMLV